MTNDPNSTPWYGPGNYSYDVTGNETLLGKDHYYLTRNQVILNLLLDRLKANKTKKQKAYQTAKSLYRQGHFDEASKIIRTINFNL